MPDSDGALCLCTNERVAGVRTGGDAISDRAARASTAAAASAAINNNYCSINQLLVMRQKLASVGTRSERVIAGEERAHV